MVLPGRGQGPAGGCSSDDAQVRVQTDGQTGAWGRGRGAVDPAPAGLAGGAGWTDGGRSSGSSCPAPGVPKPSPLELRAWAGSGVVRVCAFRHPQCCGGLGCVPSAAQCVCGRVSTRARWGRVGTEARSVGPLCPFLRTEQGTAAGDFRAGAPGDGALCACGVVGEERGWARAWGFQRTKQSSVLLPSSLSPRSGLQPDWQGAGRECPSMLSAIKNNPG